MGNSNGHHHKVSVAMLMVTLGIIYGDIGTSPLYVFKAIIGSSPVDAQLVYGGISCIFWTLTLQTTIKYVMLTLNADNRGEGGILALYALVRKQANWLIVPAIIGGSALLADGLITPPISVSSAIEGLALKFPHLNTVPIVCVILAALFLFQRLGTAVVGAAFGPIMFGWFTMLAILGLQYMIPHPEILASLNPYYAFDLLVHRPNGFWLLGAVFLCTTGAEALYSDLGHCGKENIRITWVYVKICLILNYMGQGAWLLQQTGKTIVVGETAINPFYAIMPDWFLWYGIAISTLAAIIASQALITGSFTLVSEAMRLNMWFKQRVIYTSNSLGQIYVPSVNLLLGIGCILITLYFEKSENMEAAYGLSISLTMLMTSILIGYFMWYNAKFPKIVVLGYFLVHGGIEISFLTANLSKFSHGGYVTLLIAGGIAFVMYVAYQGRKIRNRLVEFVDVRKYLSSIGELSVDATVPKYATHLVYLTKADNTYEVEKKVIYSIFENQPKRADVYWLVHIDVLDTPNTMEYSVTTIKDDDLIRVDFRVGFRVEQRINLMFKMVLEEVCKNKEVHFSSPYAHINEQIITGDHKFVVIEKILSAENNLPWFDKFITDFYILLKRFSISDVKAYHLDRSSVVLEQVSLFITERKPLVMKRIEDKTKKEEV